MSTTRNRQGNKRGADKHLALRAMGIAEHEESRFFFVLNKSTKSGDKITHTALNGSTASKPADWGAFRGLALAREKLSNGEIWQQIKELGVKTGIVPLI